ncbi:SIR2 family NAD-dependent protein deacylase [Actinomadura rupiterrae]|uniref:SIR2 family NAD-dependent protein deacylase n=1 Tax=Actinomadura rupiterrae TaxID=559627 RepID=UPI0020A2CE90|nr:Sir2 family NAD-dependent protein deacetylase [Actinomadura rupiterrae]MCP2341304.1 NAD-dependent deacetylase [Actinomadura rupiterrae]
MAAAPSEPRPGDAARAAALVSAARRITVLTGAGISTDSGIPDFRGPQGVWTKDPAAAAMSTIGAYISDPEVRRRAWRNRLAHPAWGAGPNPGHAALVGLERAGRLHGLVTQNIDGLHQAAGSAPALVLEIHGTMREAECLACGLRTPMPEVLARVEAGEEDPLCPECGGIQKSATISFGQALRQDVLDASVAAARSCDLLLAVGTSLTVHPAAGLCDEAVEHGAWLVIMNAEPTPYDPMADAIVRDPIGEALPRLVAAATDGSPEASGGPSGDGVPGGPPG